MDDETAGVIVVAWVIQFGVLALLVSPVFSLQISFWWLLTMGIIPGVLAVLDFWDWSMEVLDRKLRVRKIKADERAVLAQEVIDGLRERAYEQHVLLEIGYVDNRDDKIAKGTYGTYLPHQLDWPEGLSA